MFDHAAFRPLLLLRTRLSLRTQGYKRDQINDMIDGASDEVVTLAVRESGVSVPPAPVGAFGDGTIVQAIIDFLKSEQGQALIAALIKILLAAIGA